MFLIKKKINKPYFLLIFFIFISYSNAETKNIPLDTNKEYLKRSVLVISHEKIFSDTNLGKAIFEKFKSSEKTLSIEAEKIEQIFIEEEKELTLNRPNLSSEDFLKLANDFDKRVELERQNQRRKESIINENLNIWKKKFFNIYMIPIIQEFMKIYEASIVIDIDSDAFRLVIFDSRINITERIIERMNNSYQNIEEHTIQITS